MIVGDRVRVSAGVLALGAPDRTRVLRGTVNAVSYEQEWDTWTLDRVKVDGRWWPSSAWEKDQ